MRVPDDKNIKIDNHVIEVTHSPTGFMLIKREVFDKMKKTLSRKRDISRYLN